MNLCPQFIPSISSSPAWPSANHCTHHEKCQPLLVWLTSPCLHHLPKTLQMEHVSWMGVLFESPVPRLEKDRDWTRPRPEKTGPAVQVFDFWESKTRKRLVFMDQYLWLRPVWTGKFVPPIYPFKTSPRLPKTVKIWLRNKINYAMLTKTVDFDEYYCINFNSQPYLMFLGSF